LELLISACLIVAAAPWREVRAHRPVHERHGRTLRRRLQRLSAKPHGGPPREP
jgi:hypothetical protein